MKKAGDECGVYVGVHEVPCKPGELPIMYDSCLGKLYALVRSKEDGAVHYHYYMEGKGESTTPTYGTLLSCDKCFTVVFSVDLKGGS